MLTAIVLWAVYSESINRLQWVCIILTVAGLVVVLSPHEDHDDSDGHVSKGTSTGAYLMFISCVITAFTSVVNSKLIQHSPNSLNFQNMMLYSQGFVMNLIAYKLDLTPSKHVDSYFAGYDNVMVLMVLLSQSLMGIAITLVFKYGGAIVKSLSVAAQSAILAVLDIVLFGLPWNASSVAGTIVVLTASYAYFSIAPELKEFPSEWTRSVPLRWSVLFIVFGLFGLMSFMSTKM
jgi:drug/metabolite transporter (DMT)-like permease